MIAVAAMPRVGVSPEAPKRPELPNEFSPTDADGVVRVTPIGESSPRVTTIDPRLQEGLGAFLTMNGSPLAAAVIIDVATGEIRAMAQGRPVIDGERQVNATRWSHFPAASLFKTVVASAAIEAGIVDEDQNVILEGGCNTIHPTGMWPTNVQVTERNGISMRRAFGKSCNGFFANVIVNDIGLGGVAQTARRFGWMNNVDVDFALEPSPITLPDPQGASTHAVGRFGAGFGDVEISAVHAAWIALALANDGVSKPLRLFRDTPVARSDESARVVSAETAARVRHIMLASVHGGTASSAFRDSRYRDVRELAGGKTGTLTGRAPRALTTLFLGLMPVEKPEVVVATIVAHDGPWRVKASGLAAESFRLWYETRRDRGAVAAAPAKPETVAH